MLEAASKYLDIRARCHAPSEAITGERAIQ